MNHNTKTHLLSHSRIVKAITSRASSYFRRTPIHRCYQSEWPNELCDVSSHSGLIVLPFIFGISFAFYMSLWSHSYFPQTSQRCSCKVPAPLHPYISNTVWFFNAHLEEYMLCLVECSSLKAKLLRCADSIHISVRSLSVRFKDTNKKCWKKKSN